MPGKVFIAGAGPGNIGLATQAVIESIKQADVIVYDYLISDELLAFKQPQTRLIFAGKFPGKHTFSQEKINKIIIEAAKKNKQVVRLKGGDPFIFGRGAEEAFALAKSGIKFEVIPGISSVNAAAAAAGIPLTHRGVSSGVTFVTGHEDQAKKQTDVDWSSLAKLRTTLVILMGIARIKAIMRKLICAGMNRSMPVCVIQWAGSSRQRLVSGTIADIAEKVKEQKISHPAVIIIGKVVDLRKTLSRHIFKPLLGLKILITRPLGFAQEFKQALENLGAQTMGYPLIEIMPQRNLNAETFRRKIENNEWIIFTSCSAVQLCFCSLNNKGYDARVFKNAKIAVIGEETGKALLAKGINADIMAEDFTMEGLLRAFKKINIKGKRIFIPHSRQARKLLCEGLKKQGAAVDEMFIYEAALPKQANPGDLKKIIAEERFDLITFTSSSCVGQFVRLLSGEKALLKKQVFAVIGPVTKKILRDYGYKATVIAKKYTVPGLVEEIEKYAGKMKK
ncbi:MAG: uroporphyrinogen-III C-methyltransferase [Candidatus Omnitrophica bacterium]|nr:uroporphyrinogen-III C-methyltransferase [Candidatus Omnitrophota bacterium]